jgi:outer membrane receptor for ferrienterochelin and colicin
MQNSDAYINLEKTGTRGFEIEYKFKCRHGYTGINYSFYIPSVNMIPNYAVKENSDAFLAFATHKINLLSGIKITNHINLNSSFSFSGPRYGITAYNEITGDTTVHKFNPTLIANVNLSYDDLFVKGLNGSIGVYNLLDAKEYYIQPYNSLHAPLPGYAREFAIKISYNINFKQQ